MIKKNLFYFKFSLKLAWKFIDITQQATVKIHIYLKLKVIPGYPKIVWNAESFDFFLFDRFNIMKSL